MNARFFASTSTLVVLLLSACATHPLGIGRETRSTPAFEHADLQRTLDSLASGMTEDTVFKALGVDPKGSNVTVLDTQTLFQHVSLLHHDNGHVAPCTRTTTALPYRGYRLYAKNVRRDGYFTNAYTWTRRSRGKDVRVDLLFECGHLISVATSGDRHLDDRRHAYPWSSLEDLWGSIFKGW